MRFLFLGLITTLALVSVPAGSQNMPDQKHVMTTLRNVDGRLDLVADSVAKEWDTPIVHLKGNARAYILTGPRDAHNVTLVRADEIDCNEATGEFTPRGNVRVTVEGPPK